MDQKRFQRLVRRLVAKQRPATLFKQVFFDIREQAKKWKEEASQDAAKKMSEQLGKDLADKGYQVQVDLKLGKYKGSRFVTTAKVILTAKEPFTGPDDTRLLKILNHLQTRYSPKYQFKGLNPQGSALFNIR